MIWKDAVLPDLALDFPELRKIPLLREDLRGISWGCSEDFAGLPRRLRGLSRDCSMFCTGLFSGVLKRFYGFAQ